MSETTSDGLKYTDDNSVLRADIDRLTQLVNELRDKIEENAKADEQHREHTRGVLAKFFPFDQPEPEALIPAGGPVVVPADVASGAVSEDRIVEKLFAKMEAAARR